jgi:DNA (cytosine-5)-methyltransferase 1
VAARNKRKLANFVWPEKVKSHLLLTELLETDVAEHYLIKNTNLWQKLKNYQFEPNRIYLWRRDHLRSYESGVCPTLLASMGTGGYNVPLILTNQGLRQLTERECARLQGFPDEFILPKSLASKYRYQQLGNSVSIGVIQKLATEIVKVEAEK